MSEDTLLAVRHILTHAVDFSSTPRGDAHMTFLRKNHPWAADALARAWASPWDAERRRIIAEAAP